LPRKEAACKVGSKERVAAKEINTIKKKLALCIRIIGKRPEGISGIGWTSHIACSRGQ
jgi:hypothetical protein